MLKGKVLWMVAYLILFVEVVDWLLLVHCWLLTVFDHLLKVQYVCHSLKNVYPRRQQKKDVLMFLVHLPLKVVELKVKALHHRLLRWLMAEYLDK